MPTYDFECGSCGHSYERNLKIAERDNPQTCPECSGSEVKRIIGAPKFSTSEALGLKRPPDGWIDRLKEIDRKTPGSVLKDNSRYL